MKQLRNKKISEIKKITYFAGTKTFLPIIMKLNTVEKVCHVLKTGENEVHVSDETRLKSLVPLDKMLEMAK